MDGPVKTLLGRVVYDRKPHKFTYRDLWRINRVVDEYAGSNSHIWKMIFESEVLGKITDLATEAERNCRDSLQVALLQRAETAAGDAWEGFGGGEFGGGGTSGDFRWPWQPPLQ